MLIKRMTIPDVCLIHSLAHEDSRGDLFESYKRSQFIAAGIACDFVQENHSRSIDRGIIRGLHYQLPPRSQAKLIRCIRGAILDVAVDIRVKSPTFGQHITQILSSRNRLQLWIPAGFAHGFCTLEPESEVIYKMTDYYSPRHERGVSFADPTLAINWPVASDKAKLSAKDSALPLLSDIIPSELL